MNRSRIFFAAVVSILTAYSAQGSSEKEQWSQSLECPRYSNKNSVTVRGILEGKPFEKEYALEGPDGLYPIPVEVTGSNGEVFKDVVGVIKDTKAPVIRDVQLDKETAEDSVTVKGFVDDKPFSREFGISGRSGEYHLDLEFCDESGNCSARNLTVVKNRELQKLLHWSAFEVQLIGVYRSAAGAVSNGYAALVSLETSCKEIVKEKAPKVYAVLLQTKKGLAALSFGKNKSLDSPAGHAAPIFKPLTSREKEFVQKAEPSQEPALAANRKEAPLVSEFKNETTPQIQPKPVDGEKLTAEIKAPHKEKTGSSGYQFGITRRVQMPDERGGMTIIIDDHRTGVRKIIRKDLTGKEQSYETKEIPENERQRI